MGGGDGASQFGLSNLVAIVDRNGMQSNGATVGIMNMDMAAMWRSFGWETVEFDGHDVGQILEVLEQDRRPKDKPYAFIANTVKGKGISFMENNNAWHHNRLTPEQYRQAMEELRGASADHVAEER